MTANRSFPLGDMDVGERSEPSAFSFNENEYSHVKSSSVEGNDGVAQRCRQIVEYYEDESSKPVYETARWMVEQLSPEEQETAAQCSYSYWYLSTQQKQQQQLSESARSATALREALRHMDCAEDPTEILRLFRATIEFHQTHETWLYRTCMETDHKNATVVSSERRERIHDEMTNFQTNVVRGYDKEDRAIFFAFPRKTAGTYPEGEQAFVDSLVYTIERTLACSEYRSVGRQDQLFVVLDLKQGTSPPMKTLQSAIGILQKYYPGRLKGCVIVNAPYVLRTLWKMLKPVLHPVTYQKYIFGPSVNNQKNNAAVVAELIDPSQAMPVLMPGRGELTASVSVDRFLYEVPFYELYDEYYGAANPGRESDGSSKLLRKRNSSPSTESNSTRSLSSTDSNSIYQQQSFSETGTAPAQQQQQEQEQQQPESPTKSRRPSLRRFGRRRSSRKDSSTSTGVRVSVRTLAIGKLSIESLPERIPPPVSEEEESSATMATN